MTKRAVFNAVGIPALAISAALVVLYVALLANRGFDLSDESYYYALIDDPDKFKAALHLFGWPLHFWFLALGRSVILFRLSGIAVLAGSGWLLGRALQLYYRDLDARRIAGLPIVGVLALMSYYAFWVPTPAYNMFASAAGAVILSGALLWMTGDNRPDPPIASRDDIFASMLVGIGGMVAFFSKPPFAALCGVAILAVLVVAGRRRGWPVILVRTSIVALACFLPLVAIVLATRSGAIGFLAAIRAGTTIVNMGNTLGDMPKKAATDLYYSPPFLAVSALCYVIACAARGLSALPERARPLRIVFAGVVAADFCFVGWNVFHGVRVGTSPWVLLGTCGTSLVLACTALWVLGPGVRQPSARDLLPLHALLVLPFVTAFGSAISITAQSGMALWAIVLAGALAARLLLSARRLALADLVFAAILPLLIFWSSSFPFHQQRAVMLQSSPIRLPFASDTLLVDRSTQAYVLSLEALARREGLDRGTAVVIDLSDGGPGTALVLDNSASFFPWQSPTFGDPVPLADATWTALSPQQQARALIVGPIDPAFAKTQVARYLVTERCRYGTALNAWAYFHTFERIEILRQSLPSAPRLGDTSSCH